MEKVRHQYLKTINNDTEYRVCAFYLDGAINYSLKDSYFENCSFRSDVRFDKLQNCKFSNCSFYGAVHLPINS